jgi:hypothetical protein
MNVIKALYCNQYYELKPKGKAHTAQKMGTILSTIALVLFLMSAFFLLITFFPDFEKSLSKLFRNAFGRRSGRVIGKFAGLLSFLVAFPVVKLCFGRDAIYKHTIREFNAKLALDQKQISTKGFRFFVSAVITIIVSVLVIAVKLNFID